MKFVDLGLSDELLSAIEDCGYDTPTPIQAQAIPHVLMARDLVGLAQTGTGKTASFTLPMIEILAGGRAKARMPRSLVLAPTRELAAQVAENFDTYGKNHKLNKALLVGGVSMDEQIKILDRGADVLIATPGRLLDLFERGRILLSDIKILVIDEADRMLDMGFIPDIEKIVKLLPFTRQTLLFSATMAPEIKRLTEQFLSNPREVSVAPPATTASTVAQHMVWVNKRQKFDALKSIIQNEDVKSAFVFCNRKRDIADLTRYLQNNKYNAQGLHGDMAQSQRTKTLEEFKNDQITLLVCSDVAARGLDVSDLSHVFNFDVPMNADDYVHRIGRTGRAGKTGRAWMLATSAEQKYVDAIEKRIGKGVPVEALKGISERAPSGDSVKAEDKKPRSRQDAKKQDGKRTDNRQGKPKHNSERNEKKPDAQTRSKPQNDRKKENRDDKGFGDEMPGFFSKK